jgi:hypothetical protein
MRPPFKESVYEIPQSKWGKALQRWPSPYEKPIRSSCCYQCLIAKRIKWRSNGSSPAKGQPDKVPIGIKVGMATLKGSTITSGVHRRIAGAT